MRGPLRESELVETKRAFPQAQTRGGAPSPSRVLVLHCAVRPSPRTRGEERRGAGRGELRLAGKGALPYGMAYYFVCPKSFLGLPKVAQFREWIFAAAREFPSPGAPSAR